MPNSSKNLKSVKKQHLFLYTQIIKNGSQLSVVESVVSVELIFSKQQQFRRQNVWRQFSTLSTQ